MITKLTKEQESQIPIFLNKWMNMPTVPMDHEKAELVIEKAYKLINQEKRNVAD